MLYLIFVVHVGKLVHFGPISHHDPLRTHKHAVIRLTSKVAFPINPTQATSAQVPKPRKQHHSRPVILPHRLIQPHPDPIPTIVLFPLSLSKPSLPDKLDRPARFIAHRLRRCRSSSGMQDDAPLTRRLVGRRVVTRCWGRG